MSRCTFYLVSDKRQGDGNTHTITVTITTICIIIFTHTHLHAVTISASSSSPHAHTHQNRPTESLPHSPLITMATSPSFRGSPISIALTTCQRCATSRVTPLPSRSCSTSASPRGQSSSVSCLLRSRGC